MISSVGLLLLVGSMTPQINALSLTGERDYRQARAFAAKMQKPMAVFVANGSAGWQQVVSGGANTAIRDLLLQRYVLVYVNQDTPEGKRIADALELKGKRGLVISNRNADVQAFRHEGELTTTELNKHLERFSDPSHVVRGTISGNPAPVYIAAPVSYSSPYQSPFGCQT